MSRILIAEDDKHSLKLLDIILTSAGYDVAMAGDGVKALELIRNEQFDLLITDVGLPRKDGLRLIEEANKRRRIPSIVITATDIDSATQRKSYAVGALKFMVKPLDSHEVLAAVADVLGKEST